MAEKALRTALTQIGFSANAARQITNAQNLNYLEEIKLLCHEKVTDLCKELRCPGGMIQDPHPIDPQNVGMIINPVDVMPMQAQMNLQLTYCFLRHQDCVSRPAIAADITVTSVHTTWAYM
jgi:hypothetical protein